MVAAFSANRFLKGERSTYLAELVSHSLRDGRFDMSTRADLFKAAFTVGMELNRDSCVWAWARVAMGNGSYAFDMRPKEIRFVERSIQCTSSDYLHSLVCYGTSGATFCCPELVGLSKSSVFVVEIEVIGDPSLPAPPEPWLVTISVPEGAFESEP